MIFLHQQLAVGQVVHMSFENDVQLLRAIGRPDEAGKSADQVFGWVFEVYFLGFQVVDFGLFAREEVFPQNVGLLLLYLVLDEFEVFPDPLLVALLEVLVLQVLALDFSLQILILLSLDFVVEQVLFVSVVGYLLAEKGQIFVLQFLPVLQFKGLFLQLLLQLLQTGLFDQEEFLVFEFFVPLTQHFVVGLESGGVGIGTLLDPLVKVLVFLEEFFVELLLVLRVHFLRLQKVFLLFLVRGLEEVVALLQVIGVAHSLLVSQVLVLLIHHLSLTQVVFEPPIEVLLYLVCLLALLLLVSDALLHVLVEHPLLVVLLLPFVSVDGFILPQQDFLVGLFRDLTFA